MTTFHWQSLGKVFDPEMGPDWMGTHAQVPTPLVDEEGGIIRVYIASRPEPGKTLTGFVDLDLLDPRKIREISRDPVLEPGRPGTFDEHGVMPSCAVRVGSEVYLYYSGWSRSVGVPYTNSTGLAVSRDGGRTFQKISEGPILAKSIVDPYSATSPFVLKRDRGWLMWYCSGTGWVKHGGKSEHVYDIKLAVSDDGINWRPTGKVAVSATETEEAITRPWVFASNGLWHLCYCHRRATDFRDGEGAYRFGLAVSPDLDHWQACPAACEAWPREDWDCHAQSYPAIAEAQQNVFFFHNGNGFGVEGFGVWSLKSNHGKAG
jgi:predicted GH43/DUF377 family glycosyl hydrolase